MSKSGLHLDRTLQVVQNLRGRIDGLIATVVNEQRTHQYMLERRHTEVFDHPLWKKLPQWAHADANAYFHGKADMIGRYHTCFAYRATQDGKLYQIKHNRAKADWPLWDDLYDKHGKFDDSMWSENGDWWPSGKPYSVYPNGALKEAA